MSGLTLRPVLMSLCIAGLLMLGPTPLRALEDEDPRFQVMDVQGKANAFRDESDETSRLRKGQTVDDGDRITTDSHSEAVLWLKGKAYVHLAANTQVNISRLHSNEKGLQVRLNLIRGRMLCQLDRIPTAAFEVSASKVLCRCHGTLFEVRRKKDELYVVAYEGSVVVSSGGHSEMAKPQQVMKFEAGRFRYKHHLKMEDEMRLDAWKNHLALVQKPASHP